MTYLAMTLLALSPAPGFAVGWIPPPAVTVAFPGATIAPGGNRTLDLVIRANGAPVDLSWSTMAGGEFVAGVTPSSGAMSLAADGVGTASLTVSVPALALGASVISVDVQSGTGFGRLAKVSATVFAATLGRPEVWAAPGSWVAAAGTAGSISYQIHSLSGSDESVAITTSRFNPDPNNAGALFEGTGTPTSVLLPGGATIIVSAPTTIAGNAYAGNQNVVQLSVASAGGLSSATAHAVAGSQNAGQLPTALTVEGLVPTSPDVAGRDGAVELPGRSAWLVPAGLEGVQVLRSTSLEAIGPLDFNGNGQDDRWVGRVRIPSYAAALDVIPGFVAASGDTLDVGLLAAGRAGLMLLDLRVIEDPPFGTWEDNFDGDANGIDDRILRTIPLPGFATDVGWFRAPSGRLVALVADADTGSVPIGAGYDPALAVPNTGAGVVAIDVDAAIDSLGGVSYAAGTLATPGSALDLERRGGTSPDVAVADGAGGVSVCHLTAAAGAPATVTFTPRGSVALSAAWGTPYARDLAWIPNTGDSAYVAVATGAGGVQVVRARGAGAPELVLVQQTAAPAIGLAAAGTGALAVACGSGGVAMLQVPPAAELDRIAPGAPGPYTQPVTLARLASWGAGALEVASQQVPSSSSTALRFAAAGGAAVPDLLVSDGGRVLVLRGGSAAVTAVETEPAPVPSAGLALAPAAPNPFNPSTRMEFEVARPSRVRLEVYDVRGHLVATVVNREMPAGLHTARWDGRDARGIEVGSGVYVARLTSAGETRARKLVLAR